MAAVRSTVPTRGKNAKQCVPGDVSLHAVQDSALVFARRPVIILRHMLRLGRRLQTGCSERSIQVVAAAAGVRG